MLLKYIVDMLGSGSGLSSFLHVMNSYYKTRKTDVPEMAFLNVTPIVNLEQFNGKRQYTTTRQADCGANQLTLSFHEQKDKNLHGFTLPMHIIYCPDALMNLLDRDLFQALAVHGIEYPAQKWTAEYDDERDSGGILSHGFKRFFEKNFATFFKWQMKKLSKLESKSTTR